MHGRMSAPGHAIADAGAEGPGLPARYHRRKYTAGVVGCAKSPCEALRLGTSVRGDFAHAVEFSESIRVRKIAPALVARGERTRFCTPYDPVMSGAFDTCRGGFQTRPGATNTDREVTHRSSGRITLTISREPRLPREGGFETRPSKSPDLCVDVADRRREAVLGCPPPRFLSTEKRRRFPRELPTWTCRSPVD
jgi:hypothetical protein